MISVVIRAHNEAAWLDRCLRSVANQLLPVDDIILVDNESTDGTRAVGEAWGVRMLTISRKDFSFGRAINIGFEVARHDIVAILSAHCVPVDELWSAYLAAHLQPDGDPAVCGVYGRQEPLPETSDFDARDLWTTFRDERRVQHQDYFFHNANSAVRKSLWRDHPFDETIAGVEDRAWAKQMVGRGYRIVYEPCARVYHHHGIHHGRNEERARRVVNSIRFVRDHL